VLPLAERPLTNFNPAYRTRKTYARHALHAGRSMYTRPNNATHCETTRHAQHNRASLHPSLTHLVPNHPHHMPSTAKTMHAPYPFELISHAPPSVARTAVPIASAQDASVKTVNCSSILHALYSPVYIALGLFHALLGASRANGVSHEAMFLVSVTIVSKCQGRVIPVTQAWLETRAWLPHHLGSQNRTITFVATAAVQHCDECINTGTRLE
jgi:hypothetical protein